jgi:sugar phosphate isomerase/epimerase
MNRRTFVQSLGAATAGAIALPRRIVAAKKLDRVGLELYSVRKAMKADPDRTMAAVRAIGYTDVELLWSFNNFGRTPEQVRAILKQEGLRAPSAHIDPRIMETDWQKSLDNAKLLGMQYLIVPSLPESAKTIDDWKQWADRLNTAGAAARKTHLWVAFHNEPDHMKPIDGQIPYDVFIARLDPSVVRLQLDVGNMIMGGGDPMQYLAKHRDRYYSFHLKDVVPDKTKDTELGTGIVNFKALLAAIPNLSSKPAYVEQEGPTDELASMKVDYQYLHRLRF